MFKSNQARLKSYVSERRIEEANADDHQAKLYNQLAIERGEMDQAVGLARLAKRVINNFGEEIQKPSESLRTKDKYAATDYLADAIKSGTLDQLFKSISNIGSSQAKSLSSKAKTILEDVKNKDSGVKDATNEAILEILKNSNDTNSRTARILEAISTNIAGGDMGALNELIAAAKKALDRDEVVHTKKERTTFNRQAKADNKADEEQFKNTNFNEQVNDVLNSPKLKSEAPKSDGVEEITLSGSDHSDLVNYVKKLNNLDEIRVRALYLELNLNPRSKSKEEMLAVLRVSLRNTLITKEKNKFYNLAYLIDAQSMRQNDTNPNLAYNYGRKTPRRPSSASRIRDDIRPNTR